MYFLHNFSNGRFAASFARGIYGQIFRFGFPRKFMKWPFGRLGKELIKQ